VKDGICPRCKSTQVYSSANMRNRTENSSTIPLSLLRSIPLENYVCINCGYVESYVSDQEMLYRVKDIWNKVPPNGGAAPD